MKKFVGKSFIFILGLIVLYALGELQSRRMYNYHTDLDLQWQEYLRQAEDIEQIILGHSHCDKGINPEFLSLKSFNLAFSSQDPYYDLEVFRKVLKLSPKLKSILLCFTEFSMANDESRYALHLVKDYDILMDIKPREDLGLSYQIKKSAFYLHRNSFIKDFTQGKVKKEFKLFSEKETFDRDRPMLQKNGHRLARGSQSEEALAAHALDRTKKDRSEFYSIAAVGKNKRAFGELVQLAQEKALKIRLIAPPRTEYYNQELNSDMAVFLMSLNRDLIREFALKYIDAREMWSDRNEYFFDSDHLNENGAKEFTLWLDHQLSQ